MSREVALVRGAQVPSPDLPPLPQFVWDAQLSARQRAEYATWIDSVDYVIGSYERVRGVRVPLHERGEQMMRWGWYFDVSGVLIAAIAGQESEYGRTGNAKACRNAWGLMRWHPETGERSLDRFRSWEHGIYRAARALRRGYLAEGLVSIEEIGARWAPVSGEDARLNTHWVSGVTSIYRAMGGRRHL